MEFVTDVNWLRWLISTGIVACMLFALYLFTLKFGHKVTTKSGLPPHVTILERHRLTPKHTLIYAEIDGKGTAFILGPQDVQQLTVPS